jgi:hypothetical protein
MSAATRDPDPSEEVTPASADGSEDATLAVAAARRGFRSDVALLIAALRQARVFVPLAKPLADVPVGVDQHVGDELSLSPHLLFDEDRVGFLPVFTRADLLERATDRVSSTRVFPDPSSSSSRSPSSTTSGSRDSC